MTLKGSCVSLSIGALLMLSIITITTTTKATTVYAQELLTYNDPEKGLTFSYPAGWTFDDNVFPGYTESIWQSVENQLGYRIVGIMCEEASTIPSLSGEPSCASAMSTSENDEIGVIGFFKITDLDRRVARELGQPMQEQQLTTDTVFAYYVEKVIRPDSESSYLDDSFEISKVVSKTPVPVDVVSAATGQVIGQAQAVLMEYEYESTAYGTLAPEFRGYNLFILHGDTAYSIGLEATADSLETEEVPEVLQTVADSIKLYATSPEATIPPAPTTPTVPTPSPPPLQQQQPPPSPPSQQLLL